MGVRTGRRLLPFLAASAVAACASPGLVSGTGSKAAGQDAALVAKPSPAGSLGKPGAGSGSPAGVVSNQGGSVVSNHGAALSGKVMAPPAFVSDQGGSLVSDLGGGVISNNAGRYRLAALAQVPLAGARVSLTDAAGRPVLTPESREPLIAVTGPNGEFTFDAVLPTGNLLLAVQLPAGRGTLRAIAPSDAEARRQVDVDLVATLTTAYIMARYVRPQGDAQATLDRLSVSAERDTRARAEAALAVAQQAGQGGLPAVLTEVDAVATLERLRTADQALDAQLEVVKRLLVAAGLADLGSGRPATSVVLSAIRDVAVDAAGTIFMACPESGRVWRIGADGVLSTMVGRGTRAEPGEAVVGRPGPEVGLAQGAPIALARDGRLLVMEPTRLLAVGADGRVAEAAVGLPVGEKRLAVAADGTAWILAAPGYTSAFETVGGRRTVVRRLDRPAEVWRVPPGGPAERKHRFDVATSERLASPRRMAIAADGRARVALGTDGGRILALDLATFGLEVVDDAERGAAGKGMRLMLDSAGVAWRYDGSARTLQALDGRGGTLAVGGGPRWLSDASFPPLAALPGGRLLLADGGKLYRLAPAGAELVAGLANPPRDGRADAIAFEHLSTMAADSRGNLRVYDQGTGWVWRLTPGGDARVVADLPAALPHRTVGASGVTTEGSLELALAAMRATADGATWLLDRNDTEPRVVRIGPDGAIEVAYVPAPVPIDPETGEPTGPRDRLADFHIDDAGTLTLLLHRFEAEDGDEALNEDAKVVVEVRSPGRPVRERVAVEPGTLSSVPERLAVAPDGTLFLAASDALYRLRADEQEPEDVSDGGATAWLERNDTLDEFRPLVVDARGRLLGADSNGIWVFDPEVGQFKSIAGSEGFAFQGRGVDEGTSGYVTSPCVDGAGNLFFLDPLYRQVKRVPAAELP